MLQIRIKLGDDVRFYLYKFTRVRSKAINYEVLVAFRESVEGRIQRCRIKFRYVSEKGPSGVLKNALCINALSGGQILSLLDKKCSETGKKNGSLYYGQLIRLLLFKLHKSLQSSTFCLNLEDDVVCGATQSHIKFLAALFFL